MRLNAALIACSLALPALADPRPPDGTRAKMAAAAHATVDPAPGLGSRRRDFDAGFEAEGLEVGGHVARGAAAGAQHRGGDDENGEPLQHGRQYCE